MARARSEPAGDLPPAGTDNRLTRSASVSGSQPLQHVVASSLSDRLYGRLFGDRTYESVPEDEEGPRHCVAASTCPTPYEQPRLPHCGGGQKDSISGLHAAQPCPPHEAQRQNAQSLEGLLVCQSIR